MKRLAAAGTAVIRGQWATFRLSLNISIQTQSQHK
jgi:hypothetical protein